jgi:lipopolysaccharide/colanic/teichoic acid biosynthesis glycosyltransferase
MSKPKKLEKEDRQKLISELADRYAYSSNRRRRWLYYRKKFTWLFVITATKLIKRVFDIVTATLLLIVLSPLMLVVAILIKISDWGPIFYISNRVGKWGKLFRFPKFRTMKLNADQLKKSLLDQNEMGGITFKMQKDPRITSIGAFLRKSSIDELPQLWCVLKGEMSIVGPRPPLPEEVALYSPRERVRLDITPGITCLWQVSGRSQIPFNEQVQLDRQYIESHSLWGDLKILFRTIPAVLFGRGAY